MGLSKTIWNHPSEFLAATRPEHPVLMFSPSALHATARRFIEGFPGLVTYAVKSNPEECVIANLAGAGLRGYDVASAAEIDLIRRLQPDAMLHYNNPVRTRAEIAYAVGQGVCSYSVDSASELEKLCAIVPPRGVEITVRFKLPVAGAAYDFGAKFGATEALAGTLLARVAEAGFIASLTFHPGTQCTEASAWTRYIEAAGRICAAAGVQIARLNVGGGFPSHRLAGEAPAVAPIFAEIDRATDTVFGAARPTLVCEPGRAMVAEAFTLATRVRAVRDGAHVFLNDGVYGALAELPLVGILNRIEVQTPDGALRVGQKSSRTVFGPTCDSVDRLPSDVDLPDTIEEGDFVLFHGLGAYSAATNTRFNGFGALAIETVLDLTT